MYKHFPVPRGANEHPVTHLWTNDDDMTRMFYIPSIMWMNEVLVDVLTVIQVSKLFKLSILYNGNCKSQKEYWYLELLVDPQTSSPRTIFSICEFSRIM